MRTMRYINRRSLTAMLATGALVAGAASAQGYNTPENERGWYLGAGIGQFDVAIDGIDNLDDTISNFDADDTAWKLFGGYRFNRYFALEGAYVDFGKPSDRFSAAGSSGNYSVGFSGLAPYVVGTYPIGNSSFEIFGKLGYYFYDVEVDANFDDLGGDVFNSDNSGEDFLWAAGIGMTFLQHLNVRLEYENVDVEGTDDAHAFWLSGAWRF